MKTGLLILTLCVSATTLCAQPAAMSSPSAAQDEAVMPRPGTLWSLDDCIRYAQQNNTDVQKRILKIEQGENDLSTTRFSRLPDLSASIGYNASFGRGTSADNTYKTETLQSGSLNIQSSVPLFQGFGINRKIRGQKLDLAAMAQDLERAREDVAVNIMSLYLQVLYSKELTVIYERQLALSTQQTERSRALVAEGKKSESTLYESQALQSNDALKLTQARNDLALALLNLSQALNRESASGFDIQTPNADSLTLLAQASFPASVDAVYTYAVENRPHIHAEQLRLSSSKNAVSIARSALYPTLTLNGGYGTGLYSSMADALGVQLRQNSSEFLGVSMRIPIFNRRATRNNIRTAQVSVRNQQLALTDAERSLRKLIEQAWYNATGADAKFSSAQVALSSAKVAFAYEQEKADAGRSTIFDFNDAKTRMEKAESELAQARFELIFRHKILDYYRGERLQL